MQLDFGTLCLLGIFLIVGFLLLSRLFGNRGGYGAPYGGTDFSQRGPEQRTVDNPEVQSRGAFGRPAGRSFFPGFRNTRGSGGLSRRTGGFSGFGGGRRADSPEVKSRGSFGRSKR